MSLRGNRDLGTLFISLPILHRYGKHYLSIDSHAKLLSKLYGPLNTLGSTYRSANQALVDTEKLLALLNEPTDINDAPGAPGLMVEDGEIEFGMRLTLVSRTCC